MFRKRLIETFQIVGGAAWRFPGTRIADRNLCVCDLFDRAINSIPQIPIADRRYIHLKRKEWLSPGEHLHSAMFADHDCVAICDIKEATSPAEVTAVFEQTYGVVLEVNSLVYASKQGTIHLRYFMPSSAPLYELVRFEVFLQDDPIGFTFRIYDPEVLVIPEQRWIRDVGDSAGPSLLDFGLRDQHRIVIVSKSDSRPSEELIRVFFEETRCPSPLERTYPPVHVFCAYSHKDEELRCELESHLSVLRRVGLIELWYDGRILPGTKWEEETLLNLLRSELILLLVSSDFLASEYCWGVEMQMALEKHDAGHATVIPIILRPVAWRLTRAC